MTPSTHRSRRRRAFLSRVPGTAIGRALAFLSLWLTVLGCSTDEGVRIGIKPFVEQEILGSAIQTLLEDNSIVSRPLYRCQDSFDCERALKSGYIDVMVEYSGTALYLSGASEPVEGSLAARLAAQYRPLGIRWIAPLGFENGYAWLVPTARTHGEHLDKLSDLARLEHPIRVASPPEYVRRPRDGLQAIASRYGLRIAGNPMIIADPMERYRAVLTGQADVAVGYATDGHLQNLGLSGLEDDLDAFPPYDAWVLARAETLERWPQLERTLDKLAGTIDSRTMQSINHAVTVNGMARATAGQRLLEAAELGDPPQSQEAHASAWSIAYFGDAIRHQFGALALGSVRNALQLPAAHLVDSNDPVRALAEDHHQLAILGAEDFFELDRSGSFIRRNDLWALAVLGHRAIHVVVSSAPGRPLDNPFGGRIGIASMGGEQLVRRVLAAAAVLETKTASLEEIATDLSAGRLDVALVVVPSGDGELSEVLRTHDLRLLDLGGWLTPTRRRDLPFVRVMRIPAQTYASQPTAIETLSAQVLLASSRARMRGPDGGPTASLVSSSGPVLNLQQVAALAQSVGITEAPDPALPSPWDLHDDANVDAARSSWTETLLNIFTLGFLGWLIVLVLMPVDSASYRPRSGERWGRAADRPSTLRDDAPP